MAGFDDFPLVPAAPAGAEGWDAFPKAASEQPPAPGRPPNTIATQFSSGANEGISQALGAPVDAMTWLLNRGFQGVKAATGADAGQIRNPVGGSDWIEGLMSPLIVQRQPESATGRYARRIGQNVGYGAVAAPAMAAAPALSASAAAAPGAFYAGNVAGDVAAAVGGQTAREVAPNNDTADLIASLASGAAGSGILSALMPKMTVPTQADVVTAKDAKWAAVRDAPDRLTDQATTNLRAAVADALPKSQLATDAYPNAFKMAGSLNSVRNPSISEVEDARRIIGHAVAGNPQESSVGVNMKKSIADYLDNLTPRDVTGGTGEVAADVRSARDLSARLHRYDAVANKEMRGESAAATSGVGGNMVNAQRQKIRGLFDTERDPTLVARRQGFTPDEMKAMDRVVFGGPGSSIARTLGTLSPTSGRLPLLATGIGGSSGLTAALMGGGPLLAAPALAGGVGAVAKRISERMTQKDIDALLATILNGGTPKPSAMQTAARTAVGSQALTGAIQNAQQR